ncbi:MAG: threonine synthase [Euryarchaeota archaeon]|nr:threonine synthase [Euryarchaeota archaeon]
MDVLARADSCPGPWARAHRRRRGWKVGLPRARPRNPSGSRGRGTSAPGTVRGPRTPRNVKSGLGFGPTVHVTHLECGLCGTRHDADKLHTVCEKCGGSLLARYDLGRIAREHTPGELESGPNNLWRFAPLLPVGEERHRYTLGEGSTPLLEVPDLVRELPVNQVWVKEEGLNPTGSFKARGLCVAVAKNVELGAKAFAIPTAGNAGTAMSAYAARAGAAAHVFVPEDAPAKILMTLSQLGAHVTKVKGLISDAGKACADFVKANPGVMDVSTLKEPYRAEGKKTMGLELALHFGWEAPDVVVYPTGGGTGIVGIEKAFRELNLLGWTKDQMPRLVTVQAEGCAPVVTAFDEGRETCDFWTGATTKAAGLRVPKPFADRLVLRALRASKGTAVRVSESEIDQGCARLARTGIQASPEGGAAWAGFEKLVGTGWIRRDDRVVVFNTGSALAY